MLSRKFVFTALLLVWPAGLSGQVPAKGEKDVVFFNHIAARGRIGPGLISDESIQRVRSTLSLSEVQVSALKTLLTMRDQTTQQALQSLGERQRKLEELNGQTNPNPTDIGQAFLAVREVQDQLKSAGDKFRTDFKALLSADQRSSLEKLQTAAEQAGALTELGVFENGMFSVVGPAFPGEPGAAIGFGYRLSKDH
jgi:hypothetical protein